MLLDHAPREAVTNQFKFRREPRAALIKERSVSKMQSSECVVGDKRDRHGNPIPCARKPIFAKWDRIMGSQGSSARVLTNWKMKDLRDLEAALDRAANALGVRF